MCPELRTDWLTGRSVIIAENRAGRPNEFAGELFHSHLPPASPSARQCPFCPGHEADTPPSVYEQANPAGQWQIRVIPNKFPAVAMAEGFLAPAVDDFPPEAIVAEFPCAELSMAQPAAAHATPGESRVLPAAGAHEVIVESPQHLLRTSELSTKELHHVLEAYVARLAHWRNDRRLRYALVFKNQGPSAGASLAHLHSQLIALPAVPSSIARELSHAEQLYRHNRACPYCRWLAHEQSTAERMVMIRDGFVAFCPETSLQPFETWLLPTEHEPWFERPLRSDSLERLSGALHALITRIESVLPVASYNLLLRTAPWIDGIEPWSHWRIEILPRLASLAGMELGTGIHINPLSPEHAAARLRLDS